MGQLLSFLYSKYHYDSRCRTKGWVISKSKPVGWSDKTPNQRRTQNKASRKEDKERFSRFKQTENTCVFKKQSLVKKGEHYWVWFQGLCLCCFVDARGFFSVFQLFLRELWSVKCLWNYVFSLLCAVFLIWLKMSETGYNDVCTVKYAYERPTSVVFFGLYNTEFFTWKISFCTL